MATVVYLRTSSNGMINISILCSKTKVVPLKRMIIPRLELSAAVLLTKLTRHCNKVLNLSTSPCYLWTDSSIVHTWIINHPSQWKEFVHNRTCFILETLANAQWKHVPGTKNPADCATRGLSSSELQEHSLWWKGSSCLTASPSVWPDLPISSSKHSPKDLEERPTSVSTVCHSTLDTDEWNLLHRYSSLTKLLRITTLCMRVIQKRSLKSLANPLTPEDILAAKTFWIKTVQQQHLSTEIKTLDDKKSSPRVHQFFGFFQLSMKMDFFALEAD